MLHRMKETCAGLCSFFQQWLFRIIKLALKLSRQPSCPIHHENETLMKKKHPANTKAPCWAHIQDKRKTSNSKSGQPKLSQSALCIQKHNHNP